MTKPSLPVGRAWQRMLSGRRLDLLQPSPTDIEIEDIAHGLARVARWNGQTTGEHVFSVAQHSLIVAEVVIELEPHFTPQERLAALLHDAPEYVIGDLISPFKAAIGFDYKAFERRIQAAIHSRFGLPETFPAATADVIKGADRIAAYFEATVLAGFGTDEAQKYFGHPPVSENTSARLERLVPEPANLAEQKFLELFYSLIRY